MERATGNQLMPAAWRAETVEKARAPCWSSIMRGRNARPVLSVPSKNTPSRMTPSTCLPQNWIVLMTISHPRSPRRGCEKYRGFWKPPGGKTETTFPRFLRLKKNREGNYPFFATPIEWCVRKGTQEKKVLLSRVILGVESLSRVLVQWFRISSFLRLKEYAFFSRRFCLFFNPSSFRAEGYSLLPPGTHRPLLHPFLAVPWAHSWVTGCIGYFFTPCAQRCRQDASLDKTFWRNRWQWKELRRRDFFGWRRYFSGVF